MADNKNGINNKIYLFDLKKLVIFIPYSFACLSLSA